MSANVHDFLLETSLYESESSITMLKLPPYKTKKKLEMDDTLCNTFLERGNVGLSLDGGDFLFRCLSFSSREKGQIWLYSVSHKSI